MVYISHLQNTVLCIVKELKNLADVCKEHNVPLFMDGARLGYGLMSDQSDLTFEDIAKYCDIFYIGGTKIGALCGEFTTKIMSQNTLPLESNNMVLYLLKVV